MYGKRLRELRERIGLNQTEIAKLINISKSQYCLYEKETALIPMKHLNTLCNYFHISIDYVFSFTDTKSYPKLTPGIDKIKSGKRLKEFRKMNNFTQNKLANFLNTVQPTIVNYENGKNLIATPFLYTICKEYHVSADYLLGKIN